MTSISNRRAWLAFRVLAALIFFALSNLLRSQDPEVEVRRASAVDAVPPAGAPIAEVAQTNGVVEPAEDSPVERPTLERYAKLWTESLFTTRALPAPAAPPGPTFADNLTLSGTYEMNGKLVAILIDKTTSGVIEAYIGEDNDAGIRISKVEPGAGVDTMKIQLQKASEVGWVSFADANATSEQVMARPVINAAPPAAPVVPQFQPPMPVPVPTPVQPAPQAVPQYNLNAGMPQAAPAVPSDVPLPPP